VNDISTLSHIWIENKSTQTEVLEIVVGSNTTPQNRLMRRWFPPFINTCSGHLLSDVGLFNTSCHEQHYCAWFVDINDGWSDNGDLIAGSPMDLNGGALISSRNHGWA